MRAAHMANRALARTISIGVDLGADLERGWTVAAPDRHFATCREAGFTAVRLAVVWAAHTGPAPGYVVDPAALDHVAALADAALEAGLAVVVDNHLDPQLMSDPVAHRDRLLAATRQVATRFASHPPNLVLEPLAEPRDALDPVWNSYLTELVATVREADPDRTLVAGPAFYNTVLQLDALDLPEDDNLILTIHQYWPIPFTMQGEDWFAGNGGWEWLGGGGPNGWLGTTWTGNGGEHAELEAGYDGVARYAAARDLPVFVGEFGASNRAEPTARATWARANRCLAEQHGFAWGWWSLGPTFAAYNATTGTWDDQLLAALTGP